MSRYAEIHLHKNLAGPGDARPTALQVIEDEGLINKLAGKVFLVTGVSSGIGIETFRALHSTGADVYGTVRNMAKGRKVLDSILAEKFEGGGKLELIDMDLTSFESIRKGTATLLEKSGGKLNAVIANAGIMAVPEGRTKDGWEMQFGTNHLGHFLLFQLVKDALLSTTTAEFPSRFVSVTSRGHTFSSIRFEDINFEKTPYNPWLAYGQSKTANVWLANAIERKFGSKNLHATSVHPGGILETGLANHFTPEMIAAFDLENPIQKATIKNRAQGAATQVLAAVGAEWKDRGGKYLANCAEEKSFKEIEKAGAHRFQNDGYAEWAYDEEGEEKLWKESLKMVGMQEE